MSDNVSVISEVRKQRLALSEVLQNHTGIRELVEELYPDEAHFLYELLQNAEDTGAKKARFALSKDELVFEHDGRPFNKEDLFAITDIGRGTKKDSVDQIGRFGIGFKAVFAYSETPHIWSPTFSFKISNLVLPTALAPDSDLGGITRFRFPFNNPQMSRASAYKEIRGGLYKLSIEALLFLTHLEYLEWTVDGGVLGALERRKHRKSHYSIVRTSAKGKVDEKHYLIFEARVAKMSTRRVSIAYPLEFLRKVTRYKRSEPLSTQMRISTGTKGLVCVYFPAEKELSNLRFHLNAPFVPEVSRASVKDTPVNTPLFEQLAVVAASSLHHIRDLGLLTTDFLGALPNPRDSLSERYEVIRDSIVKEMQIAPLTPTHTGGYAPAKTLLQASSSLKALLVPEDLAVLTKASPDVQWSASALRGSDSERFLDGLAMEIWKPSTLLDQLATRVTESPGYWPRRADKDVMDWLSTKSVDWLRAIYSFLDEQLLQSRPGDEVTPRMRASQKLAEGVLKNLRIIRTATGDFRVPSDCFFASSAAADVGDIIFVDPDVHREIEQEGVRKPATLEAFLRRVGVRDLDLGAQIRLLLERRYRQDRLDGRREDLKLFVSALKAGVVSPDTFKGYFIFELSGDTWGNAGEVYVDAPLHYTGLGKCYKLLSDAGLPHRKPLAEWYALCDVLPADIVEFSERIGAAVHSLEIKEKTCRSNPQWKLLRTVPGERVTRTYINRDHTIDGLPQLLAAEDVEICLVLWNTMFNIEATGADWHLDAIFQKNEANGFHDADSQLVHTLRETCWIPQTNGTFVTPAEATADLLPSGFRYVAGSQWLERVGFGKQRARELEQRTREVERARQAGFDTPEELEAGRWFATLSPSLRANIMAVYHSSEPADGTDDASETESPVVLIHGKPRLVLSPELALVEPPSSDTLEQIHNWWVKIAKSQITKYESLVFPGGSPPRLSSEVDSDEDREVWLSLLMLGAFHTMGRQRMSQHRRFLEHCRTAGWMRQFVSSDTPREFWVQLLDDYFDARGEEGRWYHWIRMLPSIYVLSRFLTEYCELFSSLNRWPSPVRLEQFVKPRSSSLLRGGGPQPPALHKIVGLGVCFIIRELVRAGVIVNEEVKPLCYVPTQAVRRVVEAATGRPIRRFGHAASEEIHERLCETLGTEKALFGGAYDLPLQCIAYNRNLQERFFTGATIEYIQGEVDWE